MPVSHDLKDTALKFHWTLEPSLSALFLSFLCPLMLFLFSCTPFLEALFHSVTVFGMKPAAREVCRAETGWVTSQSREQCSHYQVAEGNFNISCLLRSGGSHTQVTCFLVQILSFLCTYLKNTVEPYCFLSVLCFIYTNSIIF